jgi:hypothetical protein
LEPTTGAPSAQKTADGSRQSFPNFIRSSDAPADFPWLDATTVTVFVVPKSTDRQSASIVITPEERM